MIQDRICQTCGAKFKGGPRAYYCDTCRADRQREQSRRCKERQKNGTVRLIGSTDICERCNKPYTVVAGLQRFCPVCQPIHATEYDRDTSIEYYKAHSDVINPLRNDRRRQEFATCKTCGKQFEAHTVKLYCSDECKRVALRLQYKKADEKRNPRIKK